MVSEALASLEPPAPKGEFCLWGSLKSSLSCAANERIREPGLPDVLRAIFQAQNGWSKDLVIGQLGPLESEDLAPDEVLKQLHDSASACPGPSGP